MYQTPASSSVCNERNEVSQRSRNKSGLSLQKMNETNEVSQRGRNKSGLSLQKMNEINVAAVEAEARLKKGSRKSGSARDPETAINLELSKKTRKPRSAHGSKKYIEEALNDHDSGQMTVDVIGSDKSEHKLSLEQTKDEIQVVKKGVKHKKVKSSGEVQPRTKARKLQSPDISSVISESVPTEEPGSATAVSQSKNKQKSRLSSPTGSSVDSRKLGQQSKTVQLKSRETSKVKHIDGSVPTASHKSPKKLKVAGTTAGAVDSLKKKIVVKKKDRDGVSKHCQHVGNTTVALTEIDTGDPMAVLMMMEGRGGNPSASQLPPVPLDEEQDVDEQAFTTSDGESDGMSDWEDVYDYQVSDRSQIPDGPVEITLEMPDILKQKKRQKKGFDWKAYLERRVKRFKKEVAADMHKVHLLCLLALGLRQNDVVNDHTMKGVILSLLPSSYLANKKLQVQTQVENLLLWHKRKFPLENVTYCSNTRMVASSILIDAVSQKEVTDARVWILLFICLLRTVGLTVRLVLSFQPMRFKAHQGWDEKKGGRRKQHRTSTDQMKEDASPSAKIKPERSTSSASTSATAKPKRSTSSASTSAKTKPERSTSSAKPNKAGGSGKAPKRRLSQRESSRKATLKNKNVLTGDSDGDVDNYSSEDQAADADNSDSDFSEQGIKKLKEMTRKSAAAHDDVDSSSSESGFAESSYSSPVNVLKDLKISSNRKILSPSTSDDEAAGGKRHGPVGHDIWLEVYFPESRKWLCFDCFKSQFGKSYSLGNLATQPLMYILGFKNDNSVKDVTARYSSQWLTHTRKNRIDQQWWTQTLMMFDSTSYNDNLLEDDEIKSQLLVRPMPTSIAEFKNHPLYALRRHLLKFEAIYPDSAIPLGYVKKEPVYARECVHCLHSRDNWLKEGRLVRLNERSYKMVKSRPKWNKPKQDPDALDLELFGEWQTEKYMPPPAVNGKVPRNEYGNVELFKPWMMPLGTVQVRGQGLQRVAKKLNIDVAPAMVGWDNHSGFSHPIMDGWIVCEEYADTLMAAWLEDQEIQKQREQEKKDKQVYDNWRRLIRGLLIRERLKNKFLQEAAPAEKIQHQEKFSDAEEVCDVQLSWPRNRQDEVTGDKLKAVEVKTEREKKLLTKDVGHNSKIWDKKVHNDSKLKVESSVGKVQVKNLAMLPSKCKRKVPQACHSDSSSSGDDEIVNPKVLQRKVKKIRNSVEEEDPDFVVCENEANVSQKNRNVKNKMVAGVRGDEGRAGNRILHESSRRTSLARQVKKKVKFVDASSDDSEIDEKPCFNVGDDDVKDESNSSVDNAQANVTCSKTGSVPARQMRTRLKPKT